MRRAALLAVAGASLSACGGAHCPPASTGPYVTVVDLPDGGHETVAAPIAIYGTAPPPSSCPR